MIFILHCSLTTSERWTLSRNIKQSDSFRRKNVIFPQWYYSDYLINYLRHEPHHQGRSWQGPRLWSAGCPGWWMKLYSYCSCCTMMYHGPGAEAGEEEFTVWVNQKGVIFFTDWGHPETQGTAMLNIFPWIHLKKWMFMFIKSYSPERFHEIQPYFCVLDDIFLNLISSFSYNFSI